MAALDRFAAQPRDCSDDFDSADLRMSQLLLCADSLHLWRAMDSEDTDVVLGALKKFDAACRAYTDAAVCAHVARDRPELA
jgi:hypothetical protein